MSDRVLPDTRSVEKALFEVLREDVSCRREGDAVVLDTPYALLDGHFLQVFIEAADDLGHIFSDGGFLQRQVGVYSRTTAMSHGRGAEIGRIAKSLDLEWRDFELRFHASDLERGLRRLTVLVEAVNRALALIQSRPPRREIALRKRLASELRAIENVVVRPGARIPLGDQRPVRVDYLVRRNGIQAAIEVLGGKTDSGSAISVDRAIANFQVLGYNHYPGRMVGVYDEHSPAAREELRERFRQAAPAKTLLLAGSEAPRAIQMELFG